MKKINILFVFFLLISFAYAAPPAFIESTTSGGQIIITYPIFTAYSISSDFLLNFRAHNSTGFVLTNDSTSCGIHIYNETEHHILEKTLSYDIDDFDYYTNVSANFLTLGNYQYVIYCNNTNEAGFSISGFQITSSGQPHEFSGVPLAALIMLPIIFCIILVASTLAMGPEHQALKFGVWLFTPVFFWLSMHIGAIILVRYYGFTALQEIIGSTIYWTGWLFFLMLSYIAIYIIYLVFKSNFEKKTEELEY